MNLTQSQLEQAGFIRQLDGTYAKSKFISGHDYDIKTHCPVQDTLVKSALCNDTLGKAQRKEVGQSRTRVRIVSRRRRLLDPDNLAGGSKYLIDGLRYAGLLKDDSPDYISLIVEQVKCGKGEERTEIEIESD